MCAGFGRLWRPLHLHRPRAAAVRASRRGLAGEDPSPRHQRDPVDPRGGRDARAGEVPLDRRGVRSRRSGRGTTLARGNLSAPLAPSSVAGSIVMPVRRSRSVWPARSARCGSGAPARRPPGRNWRASSKPSAKPSATRSSTNRSAPASRSEGVPGAVQLGEPKARRLLVACPVATPLAQRRIIVTRQVTRPLTAR